MGHPVVMGRRPGTRCPTASARSPGRRNVVVTRNPAWHAEGAERAASLDEALAPARRTRPQVFVIGGARALRGRAAAAPTSCCSPRSTPRWKATRSSRRSTAPRSRRSRASRHLVRGRHALSFVIYVRRPRREPHPRRHQRLVVPDLAPGLLPGRADPEEFLRLYAERLDTVELNATGYRLPSEEQFARGPRRCPTGSASRSKRRPWRAPARHRARSGCARSASGSAASAWSCRRHATTALLELLLGSFDPAVRWAFDLRHELGRRRGPARRRRRGAGRRLGGRVSGGSTFGSGNRPTTTMPSRRSPRRSATLPARSSRSSGTRTSPPPRPTRSVSASCSNLPSNDQLRGELESCLAEDLAVRSTSAAVVAGDMSAMLWNGVRRTPRLSAYRCM